MSEPGVPDEIRRLANRREAARTARDFAAADELRDQIRRAGFDVTDTPSGPALVRTESEPQVVPRRSIVRPHEVRSLLDEPPSVDVSFQWVVQGWPEDVVRGFRSVERHRAGRTAQHVVIDLLENQSPDWSGDVD